MGSALTNFVTTGKGDFKGFVSSVLTDIARMEVAAAESKLLGALIPMIAGAFGYDTTGGAGTSTYNSMGGVTHVNFAGSAKGNVFNTPSLSAYSNTIVDKPTFFAKGGNVMGEAGPEAIMPLKRGSDGTLGVRVHGGGGDININTSVTVDNNGAAKSQTSSDSSDAMARALAAQMEAKAKEVVLRATQPGGILWKQRVGA